MIVRLVCLVIGYVCGLFQTSYFLGRKQHIDIRKYGSGNAGTTNAMRVMGKKAGALTLLGDCLKCICAILIVRGVFGGTHSESAMLLSLYGAAGCILGHNFPVYLGFKGGKGIAASVGLTLGIDWKITVVAAIVFFTVFFLSHYVSAASMSAYVTALAAMIVFGRMGLYPMEQPYLREMYLVMAGLTVLAVIRHKDNIKRLFNGTENKLFLSKKSEQKG